MDEIALARARKLNGKESSVRDLNERERDDIRLGFAIHDVSRIRRNAYDQYMKPLGITRAQWTVLAQLSRHDGMVQTKLAKAVGVGKASIGSLITTLEANGLIVRHSDPVDQRAKRVYLTRSAQDLIKRMAMHEIEFNEKALVDLSTEERKVLFRSLIKIKHALARFAAGDLENPVDDAGH